MSALSNLVVDTFPANNDVGVPLRTNITFTLSGLDYDTSSLTEGMFVEGPDTDKYIGPGLIEQVVPNNISQGNLDDFLESPGYQGIVQGVTTVSVISGDTVVTFSPTLPFVPLIDYVVNLTGVTNIALIDIDGFITFGFESGTGSIETVPDTVSSSVLSASAIETTAPATTNLTVTSTTPKDRSVEHSIETNEIVIEFNKALNPASVAAANIQVKAIPVTDHPNAGVTAVGDIAKVVTVEGNKLKIKI